MKLHSLLALYLIAACGPSTSVLQARTVDSANSSIQIVLEVYKGEGLVCVERASTKDDARTCVEGVRKRYAPIWVAWETFRKAPDKIEAWCTFAKSLPAEFRPKALADISC